MAADLRYVARGMLVLAITAQGILSERGIGAHRPDGSSGVARDARGVASA